MLRFAVIPTLLLCFLAGCDQPKSPSPAATTTTTSSASYVGSEQCQNCHQAEQQQWRNSDHHQAMKLATTENVIGNFSAPPLKHHQQETAFSKVHEQYRISTDQETPAAAELTLQYTFGVFPLQQYLTAQPNGHWQSLPFAWDARPTEEGGQRWFHLYADERVVPNDVLHWRSPSHNANHMCIECHTTDFKKNFQADSNAFQSTWVETGVGCESCHGPGSNHLAWAKNPTDALFTNKGWDIALTSGAPALWKPQTPTEKPSRTEKADTLQVDRCAQCHSRRSRIDTRNDKEKFLDAFMPALLDENLYFPDGQIQDEVYEYGSFLQSKMAMQGVTCSNCHNPHSGKVKIEGNGLCLQCHNAEHDTPKHTLHESGTPGSFCVDCHMPTRTYMTVDARRDHSFRIPRPDLSATLNTPNACTNCHADKTNTWATDAIDKNAGSAWKTPHYGSVLAQARLAKPSVYDALVQLIQDDTQAPIVRATGIGLLVNFPTRDVLPLIKNALRDNNDLLRLGALRATEALSQEQQAILLPLLDDAVLAIRIEAARQLAGNPIAQNHASFTKARQAYIDSQEIDADRAAALTNLAGLAIREQRLQEAETLLKTAIEREPYYIPASINFADLYRMLQQESAAGSILKTAMQRVPENADLMMSYALWLVRSGNTNEAVQQLKLATQHSQDPHIFYLYAIALNQVGKTGEAFSVLDKATALPTYNRNVQLTRFSMALDNKQYERADKYLRAWQLLDPQDPTVLEVTNQNR